MEYTYLKPFPVAPQPQVAPMQYGAPVPVPGMMHTMQQPMPAIGAQPNALQSIQPGGREQWRQDYRQDMRDWRDLRPEGDDGRQAWRDTRPVRPEFNQQMMAPGMQQMQSRMQLPNWISPGFRSREGR